MGVAEPPLEREGALAVLSAQLMSAARGEGRLVLVAGEAGIGKTRLMQHFVHGLPRDTLVHTGACDPLSTPRPLETRRPPAVVVFEDLHWADEATLDLVKFLGRRMARLSVLFIVTYRDDEVGLHHPLRSLLGELPRDTTLRIAVQRLSEAAVAVLARDAKHKSSPARLHSLTAGNPFFVTEILASGGEGVTTTLRGAVLARAARLAPKAREALDVASISPVAVEPSLIEACVDDVSGALDECLAAGMLQAQGTRHAFRHELARLAVLDAIPPQRRTELARRLLRALEADRMSPI